MITPRRTRLLRAPALRAFQRAISATVAASAGTPLSPVAVLTPSRAATGQLRRTLDGAGVDTRGASLVTRAEWYEWLRERNRSCPPVLTAVQREVVGSAAAGDALAAGLAPPFRLRPGIVAALLAFYDQLRRRRRSVEAFERLMVDELEPSADLDRGARRLLLQTRFLVAAFRAYERRIDAIGGLDEHRLRERLLAVEASEPVSEIVVTVPDQVAHAAGLYPADYDLLARLPHLARVTVISTDAVLDSGYRERLDDLLPGITEARVEPDGGLRPNVVVPDPPADRSYFVWRDREEELRGVAGQIGRTVAIDTRPPASAAVVVQRPLPYLYLAPAVFEAAALPVSPGGNLPLAVEPYAAAVDLVLAFVTSGFRHGPALALLRSPHFRFETGAAPPTVEAIRALDRALSEIRFTGGAEALSECAADWSTSAGVRRAALPALRCVLALAGELRPLSESRPLAAQLATMRSFLERYAPAVGPDGPTGRGVAGRALVREGLEALETANRALNDGGGNVDVAAVALVVRRWIESRTFPVRSAAEGVHLVDAQAAPYGRFDDVFLAGLVESEWPARANRNIFYPGGLLAGLGWPRERDRLRAARAAFRDLVGLAVERAWLSTFSLEDDALVTVSPLLGDLDGMDIERLRAPEPVGGDVPADRLAPRLDAGPGHRWRALRIDRASRAANGGRTPSGLAGRQPERSYSVSSLERYAACPFQYFASHALGLEAERAVEQTLTPEQRGLFLHGVFESFFRLWQADGEGAVTLGNLDRALERFAAVAEDAIERLAPIDRTVARGWLLGSAAAPGLAERVFVSEIESQTGVVERLLEYRIDGRFEFGRPPGRRTVAIRGVVDRLDLHADRTFRVVDYKASRPPHPARALQLPVYASCAQHMLRAERGEDWRAAEAVYVAFGDPRLQVSVPGGDVARAMADGEARVVELVESIEAGEYPPRPVDRSRCASCSFPTVCRKDHVEP